MKVATDNPLVMVARRIGYGRGLERPTYNIADGLFLRMLGVVYFFAFVSLWTQITQSEGYRRWAFSTDSR